MTFGRCSTNGASGTFIDEQCGSSASATERTAYSCSSRSFDDRARVAARVEVAGVVAGAADGAGQHARGDEAAFAAHQQLGGRAEEPVDVEGPAGGVGLGEAPQRPAHVDVLVGGRHEVAREHDLLEVAGVDPRHGVGDDPHPLLAVAGAVGERTSRGAGGTAAATRGTSWTPIASVETVVTHATSPRRPTTTSGTTSMESPGSSANARVPKQTRPLPGSSTSSRTTARAVVSDHHLSASANRVGAAPCACSRRRPSPTSPSPRRSQATDSCSGSRSTSASKASVATVVVRTTSGRSRSSAGAPRVTPRAYSVAARHRTAGCESHLTPGCDDRAHERHLPDHPARRRRGPDPPGRGLRVHRRPARAGRRPRAAGGDRRGDRRARARADRPARRARGRPGRGRHR